MKAKNVKYALAGTALLALFGLLLIAVNVRSQQGQANIPIGKAQATEKELDDEATPIVNFEDSGTVKVDKNSPRGIKNARYNKYRVVVSQPPPNAGEVGLYSDPKTPISDLPVDESALIVEGIVTNSEAFLSEDKSGVYSEFSVRVSRVLKVNPDLSVRTNDTIITERFGGRVRYPSGKIVRYKNADEGSPVKGEKYLFFLKEVDQNSYKILTAYELRGNKVFALDGSRTIIRGPGRTIFQKHDGEGWELFIAEVESAIQSSKSQKSLMESATK